jgi:hypothetical protein
MVWHLLPALPVRYRRPVLFVMLLAAMLFAVI